MTTRKRKRFVYGITGWLLGVLLILALLDAVDLELFFTLGLIGFLVVVELTEPLGVHPRWRRRLRWIIAVGLAVFGYVVYRRVVEILPPGVL